MKSRLVLLTVCLGLFATTAVWAHHSLAAEFDQSKTVTLNATITSVDWRNPHAWLYIDVKTDSGAVEKWQCELGSPNAMTRVGFGPTSAKPGDEIVISGYLAKDGSKTISTRTVNSPDGTVLLSQSAGRGGPGNAPGAGKGKGK